MGNRGATLKHTQNTFSLLQEKLHISLLVLMFLPEVIKGCGVDLLSQDITDGGIGHNISMQKSETKSQEPKTKLQHYILYTTVPHVVRFIVLILHIQI